MVNPSEQIQSIYNLLISVEERILTDLKDGAKLSDVYKSAVSLVKKENSELVDKLTKNFGFAMWIEFREASLSIAPNCDAVAKKGKKIVQKSHFRTKKAKNSSTFKFYSWFLARKFK